MNIYLREPPTPVPPWMSKLVFGVIGKVVCFGHSTNKVNPCNTSNSQKEGDIIIEDTDELKASGKECLCERMGSNEEILLQMKKLSTKVEEDSRDDELKFMWKEIAKVLDRFFLLMFLLIQIGVFLCLFFSDR